MYLGYRIAGCSARGTLRIGKKLAAAGYTYNPRARQWYRNGKKIGWKSLKMDDMEPAIRGVPYVLAHQYVSERLDFEAGPVMRAVEIAEDFAEYMQIPDGKNRIRGKIYLHHLYKSLENEGITIYRTHRTTPMVCSGVRFRAARAPDPRARPAGGS